MKTLADWLAAIEKLHPKNIQLGLERVEIVAKKLGLLQYDCPVVTVGGTNGKGSCIKFLESILHSNHYQVGVYTSPHLLNFNERIRINNLQVSDQQLIEAFKVIEKARGTTLLTFFEFTTLACLWLFKLARLDAIILEVGLGGRLDAVNIVDADIAVITSVDLDHLDWLGSTREEIGLEKAGIFKRGKIAICGDVSPPMSLLEQAKKMHCPLYCINRDFAFEQTGQTWSWHHRKISYRDLPLPNLPIINAAIALMVLLKLSTPLNLSLKSIKKGIAKAALRGRYEKVEYPYPCILDVAHNPASARMLASKLQAERVQGKFKAVVGMLKDKDIKNTLSPLVLHIDEWYLGSLLGERAASSEQLAFHLKDFKTINCYNHNNVSDAFKAAANSLNYKDRIVVFGSFYTVAEVINLITNYPSNR
jgi:dihydrofolate synthase/folylpolyglutamate synthase